MSRKHHLILIADDDRDLVDALSIHCRSLGLRVEHAYDGMSALCKIDELQPNLVMLDVNMPGMTGLSIREAMASNQCLNAIPVIILTGRGDLETMRRSHELLSYFVPKCVDCWSRIEPLIKELFPEITMLVKNPLPPAIDLEPIGSAQTDRRFHRSSTFPKCYIDDLFSALGPECKSQPHSSDPAQGRESQRRTPWVLCVDDDRELSHGFKMRLEREGVRCKRAFAGIRGFVEAFEHAPAVVVLDYELPDGNGDYILRRLKETPATKDIPVIAITGHKKKSVERTMYNLGAVRFFYKPVKWDDLWAELEQHLGQQAAVSEQHSAQGRGICSLSDASQASPENLRSTA